MMCTVRSCYNWRREDDGTSKLCKYHIMKFGIKNLMFTETHKHLRVAKPIHMSGNVIVRY